MKTLTLLWDMMWAVVIGVLVGHDAWKLSHSWLDAGFYGCLVAALWLRTHARPEGTPS